MELVSNKTMLIVGYGDIGSACGKVVRPLGTKVVGLKRRPDQLTPDQRQNADEIFGMSQLDHCLPLADYVVGILPKTPQTDHFFNSSFFKKMKPTGVFFNIGRGSTCCEVDLIKALQTEVIAGAVLDVFEKEPLPGDSELWKLDNVLLTPHCAD